MRDSSEGACVFRFVMDSETSFFQAILPVFTGENYDL